MWLERFVIIVSSLAQDYLPSSWGIFHATRWDCGHLRRHHRAVHCSCSSCSSALLPMISMFEVRTLAAAGQSGKEEAQLSNLAPTDLRRDGRIRERPRIWCARPRGRAHTGYRKMDAYTPFPIEELHRGAASAPRTSCR